MFASLCTNSYIPVIKVYLKILKMLPSLISPTIVHLAGTSKKDSRFRGFKTLRVKLQVLHSGKCEKFGYEIMGHQDIRDYKMTEIYYARSHWSIGVFR